MKVLVGMGRQLLWNVSPAAHFDVSRIPTNVLRTVIVVVFRVRGSDEEDGNEQRGRSRRIQIGSSVALKIYSVSKTFPREETYSLIDQMRRAAGSVGMNLMEGAMRLGSKEYRQLVGIARGSAGEVCYQLLLARDLNYISTETYQELRTGYDRVIQMLSRLSQTLNR